MTTTTPRHSRIVWDPAPRLPSDLRSLAESLGLIVTYSHSSRYCGSSYWEVSCGTTGETIGGAALTLREATAFLNGFQVGKRIGLDS